MIGLRITLGLVWLIVLGFTVSAIGTQGLVMVTDVFAGDVAALNWRSQFNVDLIGHMLLAGLWVAWRHKFSVLGMVLGLLCINGVLFTALYVLVLTFVHRGNLNHVVMGKHVDGVA